MEVLSVIGAIAVTAALLALIKHWGKGNYFKVAHRQVMGKVRRNDSLSEDMLCGIILTPLVNYDDNNKRLKNNDYIRFEYYCFIISYVLAYLHAKKFEKHIIEIFTQSIEQCTTIFEHILYKHQVRDIFISRLKEYDEYAQLSKDVLSLLNTNILFALSTKKPRTSNDRIDDLHFSITQSADITAHTSIFFTAMIPTYCEPIERFLVLKFKNN